MVEAINANDDVHKLGLDKLYTAVMKLKSAYDFEVIQLSFKAASTLDSRS